MMKMLIQTVNSLIFFYISGYAPIVTKIIKCKYIIHKSIVLSYIAYIYVGTLQMQSLIRECISADPSSRPDIHYVFGVAQDMHSRSMLRHPVARHPPSTVSIRGVPLHSTLAYTSSSVELSVQETRELPSASFLS